MKYLFFLICLIFHLFCYAQKCDEKLNKVTLSGITKDDFDFQKSDASCVFFLKGMHNRFMIGELMLADQKDPSTLKGDLRFFALKSNDKVNIGNCTIAGVFLSKESLYRDLTISYVEVKNGIAIADDTVKNKLYIQHVITPSILISGCYINELIGGFRTQTESIDLSGSTLIAGGNLIVKGVKSINLTGLHVLGDNKLFLDLHSGIDGEDTAKIKIKLLDTDIDKLELDYAKFVLDTSGLNNLEIKQIYEGLLRNFKNRNDDNNYSKVFRDYQDWEYRLKYGSFVSKWLAYWSDYGLNPYRPISFLFSFLIIATIINFFLYKKLHQEVYGLENFPPFKVTGALIKKFIINLYHSFLYTIILFLSINVNFGKLHYKRVLLLGWFFIIYLSGYWFLYLILKQLQFV